MWLSCFAIHTYFLEFQAYDREKGIYEAKYIKIMNSPDIVCTLLEVVRTQQSATAAAAACTIQAAK